METLQFICALLMIYVTNADHFSPTGRYVIIDQMTNRAGASTLCQQTYSTNLASIHCEEENQELIDLLLSLPGSDRAWIGITVNSNTWDDGTPKDFTFSRQYISGDGSCMELISSPIELYWNDLDCNAHLRWSICNYASVEVIAACDSISCADGDIKTFNWDTLTGQGIDIPQYNVALFDINEDDLSLEIVVELDYIGNVTADDRRVGKFGVTYVLDFEDFDAHKDDITEPGTCQNRQDNSYDGASWDEYWQFSDQPQNDGNIGEPGNYLAYPPSDPVEGEWDVYMKNDSCDTIVYSGKFTWTNLRDCKKYGGSGNSYTDIVTDDDWVNLTGTFYINVVSPYWPDSDFGYYRVYQILSQPFIIAVSSVVNVLGSTGINLMTLSVIAVYKEDEDNDFKLVLLTETADYLKLTRDSSSVFVYAASDGSNQLQTSDFTDNTNPENTGTNECISNKAYICSQLWEINATNIGCTTGGLGTDFSGNYQLTFKPECRSLPDANLTAYCGNWLINHPNIATAVALDTELVWKDEICDPIIFVIHFEADMKFYEDATYGSEIGDDHLYQVGEDYIYVEVNTSYPHGTFDVFNVSLVEVHICTFDPLLTVPNDPMDLSTFGCFSGSRDNYDEHFYKIYDNHGSNVNDPTFDIESEGFTNIVRFSFQVPAEVARDTLYVQAELEVALQELGGRRRRRRVLLRGGAQSETANQISNFVETVGINHGQPPTNNKEPESPNDNNEPRQYYPQEPMNNNPMNPNPVSPSPSTWTINLSSPWIIGIGSILGLILALNIGFICYMNYCRSIFVRRGIVLFGNKKGYKSVKLSEDSSDFSQSEARQINVASD